MDHRDHVNLLRDGIARSGGVWADFGAGSGAFTLALAELVGPAAEIYAVDVNRHPLRQLAQAMHTRFPTVVLHCCQADFTHPLVLPLLDGIVMANSLHFQHDPGHVLDLLGSYLRPHGRLLLVEYNFDRANAWVPHPISFSEWQRLAARHGFGETRLLARRRSRAFGEIYSALSRKM